MDKVLYNNNFQNIIWLFWTQAIDFVTPKAI
jgi:hypothetical protein